MFGFNLIIKTIFTPIVYVIMLLPFFYVSSAILDLILPAELILKRLNIVQGLKKILYFITLIIFSPIGDSVFHKENMDSQLKGLYYITASFFNPFVLILLFVCNLPVELKLFRIGNYFFFLAYLYLLIRLGIIQSKKLEVSRISINNNKQSPLSLIIEMINTIYTYIFKKMPIVIISVLILTIINKLFFKPLIVYTLFIGALALILDIPLYLDILLVNLITFNYGDIFIILNPIVNIWFLKKIFSLYQIKEKKILYFLIFIIIEILLIAFYIAFMF